MTEPALERIIEAAREDFRKRLEQAFVAGGEKVRRELIAVLSTSASTVVGAARATARDDANNSAVAKRATPGTVKPTIMRLVEEETVLSEGITTNEIIRRTGIKSNSVRATLTHLRIDNVVEQIGDRWLSKTAAPANESEEAP